MVKKPPTNATDITDAKSLKAQTVVKCSKNNQERVSTEFDLCF